MQSTQSFFTAIRWYTQLDPYFYSVDNRPLTDLNTNQIALAVGVDSVRNIEMASTYALGKILSNFGSSSGFLLANKMTFSNLAITIPAGLVAVPENASTTDTTSVLKMGLMNDFTHTFTAPSTSGFSQNILLEASFADITGSESLPILDTGNNQTVGGTFLGAAAINVNAGTAAATGTQSDPTPTAGYITLARIVITNGDTALTDANVDYNNDFWIDPDSIHLFTASGRVPVRQTVLRGPVDGSGNPSLLQVGTGLSVDLSATSPVDITFASGYASGIAVDYSASLTRTLTGIWSSLTASTTCYLYVEKMSTGWLNFGFSTTAPTYAAVAPASPASGDSWYDTVNEVMYEYNGTGWVATLRVFVGEAATGTSTVTSVTSYAYRVSH